MPWTERFDVGVVVPIPTLPPAVAKYAEPLALSTVVEAFARLVKPETVSAVDEAYGNTFAAVAVEVMMPAMLSVELAVIP